MKKTNFTFLRTNAIKGLALIAMFLTLSINNSYGQCSLACNGTTNISLDELDCQATVTVGMVADVSSCTGGDLEVIIVDAQGDTIPDATVTGLQVGQTLEVIVYDNNTGNSCWGYLTVEDKLPPTIDCGAPSTVYCYELDDFAPAATDNCDSDPEVILIDETITVNDCDSNLPDNVLKQVTRTYIAQDDQGLQSAPCTLTFDVIRIDDLEDIDEPDNYLLQNGTNLECDGNFPLDANGHPSPIAIDSIPGTGVPMLDGFDLFPNAYEACNILVSYSDTELPPIGCAIKIMRTWSIIEWSCSNPQRSYEFIQMIEIVDSEGPTFVSCPADITTSTNGHACEGTLILPPANVVDNCSDDVTVDISYPGGFINNSNGGLATMPVGTHVVTYTAYDDCLNSSSCTINVTVTDLTPPVVVCDQNTTVALTSDGCAYVNATVFDDGSYDECELVSLTVRRMDNGVPCESGSNCTGEDDELFDDYVRFCCADIGEDVMVVLRATDASGNVNDCMVSVEVQDKLAPTITCPADMTVSCDFAWEEDNLSEYFGSAIVNDNCGQSEPVDLLINNLNQCNIGTLERIITVTDAAGLSATCTQLITFTPLDPFNDGVPDYAPDTDIIWPSDVTMTDCADPTSSAFNPENLPVGSQFPQFIEGSCDLVGANYTDQVFPFNDPFGDACFKIVRTWTVIDWCQFVTIGGTTSYPQWTHVQIIKINDEIGPNIDELENPASVCTYDTQCLDGFINLEASASDDCTETLDWSYVVLTNKKANGTFEDTLEIGGFDVVAYGEGNSIDASGTYPIGTHLIVFSFYDKCGNVESVSHEFSIVNCKAPTPYLLNGLAVDLMPVDTDNDGEIDGGMVSLWATDFDNGSSHPCGYEVYVSFDPVFFDSLGNLVVNNGMDFTCENLGDQEVTIYAAVVTPEDSIIQAWATTFVNIQDNMGACSEMRVGIEGDITTNTSAILENATVELQGADMGPSLTNEAGRYAFPSMPVGGSYIISPSKTDDYRNGVSTLDLVLIQRHILGIEYLNDPYLMIAADINNDLNISASDLLQLRKLILGTINELPNVGSWRFIDAAYEFEDATDPFASELPETYGISSLNADMEIDFLAIKVGDINGNAQANLNSTSSETRNNNTLVLKTQEVGFNNGETVTVPFITEDAINTVGLQMTVDVQNDLQLVNVTSEILNIDDYNVGYAKNGEIVISWNHATGVEVAANEELFTMTFEATNGGTLSESMKINSSALNAEIYDADLNVSNLELEVEGRGTTTKVFALHQNTPNPFEYATTISFDLPNADNGTLTVFDVTGKVVKTMNRDFNAGYNEITLNRSELTSAGVMYYQLEVGEYVATKKMILID